MTRRPKKVKDVLIEVRQVRRGSVIIDAQLSINNPNVLDEAFNTINDTVTTGVPITAPGGFTFTVEPIVVTPQTEYPSVEPTLDPTPMPTMEPTVFTDVCGPSSLGAFDWNLNVLDVSALTDWTLSSDGNIAIVAGEIECSGDTAGGGSSVEEVYVEQVFNATGWTQILVGYNVTTSSLDTTDEKGFVRLTCSTNGDNDYYEFNLGLTESTAYSQCIAKEIALGDCGSLTLRVGGYLSGGADYAYVNAVSLRYY